jgi:glutathione peroxidase
VPLPVDSLHDLKTTSLQGSPADLGDYRGTVVLAVNVASECGLTPQYKALQALHTELAPRGFSVLGFPSNDFGGQEPGSADQIQSFCERNYGVTFPLFAKLQTKSGPGQSPIYAFLTRDGQVPTWNFGKYLVGKDGQVIRFFPSDVTPDAAPLREAIEKALSE